MTYPKGYEWLGRIGPLPKMVTIALAEVGTVEKAGPGNNPKIMGWADEVGQKAIGYKYTGDSVPWCGLFMAVVAKRAGYELPYGPLYALNWSKFGIEGGQPDLGDVIAFMRPGGGHVGLYIGEDKTHYHILGGNQSDSVSIARVAKANMRAVRQPKYKIAKPASSRPYVLSGTSLPALSDKQMA
jgi:uncharacterized protein (TIGR02594 family)